MVVVWNVSKTSVESDVIINNELDMSNAIIDVANKYYNASLDIVNV